MTRDLTSSNGIGSLFSGKARTVAAVAAFSGLALATTVSVQAAPAQDASADAPLSAVAAATPAAAPTVSLEPVAHVQKAESDRKSEKKTEKVEKEKVETPVVAAPAVAAPAPKAAAAPAPVAAPKPAVQAAPAPKPAPAPKAAPVAAPKPAVQAAPAPRPAAAPAPKPAVQAAPAAERTVAPQSSASGKGATISSAAMGQLGVGQDCTALVTNALRAAGINHHGWPASYLSLGTQVSAGQAQPGDLVYYADGGMGAAHIGVYIGGGKAVHGGWNGGTTVIDSVNVGSGPVYVRVR
ncbi:Probable endopeptidase p60 precursor [Kocuria rosea]|uniref:C40 family peptidase n=1 Tax=Kocuria rosea TaxID=1275 RepID=UPI000F6E41C1|nr:NlpC/P60 family protein [Kocuria rosea]VEH42327.1 Probable endopeptidase p60 precursor [Kocuria rosea]